MRAVEGLPDKWTFRATRPIVDFAHTALVAGLGDALMR